MFKGLTPWRIKGYIYASRALLPTELWAMVIDTIVAELRHPYFYCKPEAFPQYRALFYYIDDVDKITASNDWKRICAVCKRWKALAGSNPYLLITQEWFDATQITSNLFIHSRFGDIRSIWGVSRVVTTLAFGHLSQDHTTMIGELLEHASAFPNLQCLSLHSTNTRRSFWKLIQDDFPQLKSLTIRSEAYGEPGTYVLENLEILDIVSWKGFRLVCPSLIHLSLRHSNHNIVLEFLILHGPQLTSLLVNPYSRWLIPQSVDFWTSTFPNLVMFGATMTTMYPGVPPSHPLRHAQFFRGDNTLMPESIMSALDLLPGVRTLHINMEDMRISTIPGLRKRCRKSGIRVVEVVDGQDVIPQWSRPRFYVLRIMFRLLTM